MAKEKILRPDSHKTKSMLNMASRIETELRAIIDSEQIQRQNAQNAAQKLFDERMKLALEAMDVEHINKAKQGIR